MKHQRSSVPLRCLVLLGAWAGVAVSGSAPARAAHDLPVYRVEIEGFDASEADVRAVLEADRS